jgi:hypothetical protein
LLCGFTQEEIPVCSCTPPDDGKMGCLDDCVNRAVRLLLLDILVT